MACDDVCSDAFVTFGNVDAVPFDEDSQTTALCPLASGGRDVVGAESNTTTPPPRPLLQGPNVQRPDAPEASGLGRENTITVVQAQKSALPSNQRRSRSNTFPKMTCLHCSLLV